MGVLFLGAGAHTAFCPDNKNLLSSFVGDNPQFNKEIDNAEKALKDYNIRSDLETVYTFLKARSDVNQAVRQTGPWLAGLVKRSYLHEQTNLKDLLSLLESYLIDKFFIEDRNRFGSIVEFYHKFIRQLADLSEPYFPGFNPLRADIPLHIFTTNYDNLIETYARETSVSFYDGYRQQTAGSPYYIFDERGFGHGYGILLFKLHGSVTLYKLQTGEIIMPHSKLRVGSTFLGTKVVENVMIFPVQEKFVSKNPYNTLDKLLRQQLDVEDQTCVVIGHAFNDEAILNAFTDSMIRNRDLQVVLLSHDPQRIVNEKFPDFEGRIKKMRGEVKSDGTIEAQHVGLP